jgi:hypothetical protein
LPCIGTVRDNPLVVHLRRIARMRI